VTDPEPLPPGHPLWSLPNCIITPHVGNTPEMAVPLLAERIVTNVRRFAAGEELIGPVDVDAGY
jgi:phosphoglycerate dehydrogenase-like enzyme